MTLRSGTMGSRATEGGITTGWAGSVSSMERDEPAEQGSTADMAARQLKTVGSGPMVALTRRPAGVIPEPEVTR